MNDNHLPMSNGHADQTMTTAQPTTASRPAPDAGPPPATVTCSIVIPVHNKASLTRQCLDTLLGQSDLGIERELIVVDDGSSDLTPRLLQTYADRVTVITNSPGKGFAGACNAGAAASTGEFVIFLNNDTIPRRRWLAALVQYAQEHPAAGIIGSKLLYPDDTVQHAGVAIGYDRYPRHVYTGFPSRHPAVNKSRRFPAVTAACLLIRRELWTELEGFDTGYRNGWEDVDLCLRAGEAGHEIHYCHESVIYHLESVSRDVRAPEERANRERYEARWMDSVIPDDINYYIEDDVISIGYQARYPIKLAISPLLATWTIDESLRESDRLLAERAKQVTILLKNNIVLNTRVHEAELRALDAEQRARAAYQRLQAAGLEIDNPPPVGGKWAPIEPVQAARRIIGSLEQPGRRQEPVASPTLAVSGWAHSPFGIAKIDAYVDDTLAATLDYSLPRPDIGMAHPGYPDGDQGGFAGEIPLAGLADGEHELRIRIHDKKGRFADAVTTIARGASPRLHDRIIGHLDEPRPMEQSVIRDVLPIRGWALSPQGIREIEALVDGQQRSCIPYGMERLDIPLHHPEHADAAHCGFSGSVTVGDLDTGEHELIVRVVANDDREANLRATFVVDPNAREGAATADAERGTST